MRAQGVSKTVPAETEDSTLVADVSVPEVVGVCCGEETVSRHSGDVDENQLSPGISNSQRWNTRALGTETSPAQFVAEAETLTVMA